MQESASISRGTRAASRLRSVAAAAVLVSAGFAALAVPAVVSAQDVMQLNVPAAEYTLGNFKYVPPKVDGWRQIANMKDALSLVYAEQLPEEKIETKFGVAMEAHDIPAENRPQIQGAQQLAELSQSQMAENRKNDLVSKEPIKQVGGNPNLFTYRLLVHSMAPGEPDAYEVYFVTIAPDKTQYLVIQCITKTQSYENEVYWAQFYGSLASIKYDAAAQPSTEAPKKADDPSAAKQDSGKPGGSGVEIAPDGTTAAPH